MRKRARYGLRAQTAWHADTLSHRRHAPRRLLLHCVLLPCTVSHDCVPCFGCCSSFLARELAHALQARDAVPSVLAVAHSGSLRLRTSCLRTLYCQPCTYALSACVCLPCTVSLCLLALYCTYALCILSRLSCRASVAACALTMSNSLSIRLASTYLPLR